MVRNCSGRENSEHEIFIARVQDTINRHSNLKGPAKCRNHFKSVDGTRSENISPIQRMRAAIDRHNSRKQGQESSVEGKEEEENQLNTGSDTDSDDDFISKSLANFIKEIDQNLEASKREFGIDTVNTLDINLTKEAAVGKNVPRIVTPFRMIPLWDPSDDTSSRSTTFTRSSLTSNSTQSLNETSISESLMETGRKTASRRLRESKIPQPKIYSRDVLRDRGIVKANKNDKYEMSELAGTTSFKVDIDSKFESDTAPKDFSMVRREQMNDLKVKEGLKGKQICLGHQKSRSKRTSPSHTVMKTGLKKVRVTINPQTSSTERLHDSSNTVNYLADELQKIDSEIFRLRLLLRSTPEAEDHEASIPRNDQEKSDTLHPLLECLEIECDEEKSAADEPTNAPLEHDIEDESLVDFFSGMKDMIDRGIDCMCKKDTKQALDRPFSPLYEKEKGSGLTVDIDPVTNAFHLPNGDHPSKNSYPVKVLSSKQFDRDNNDYHRIERNNFMQKIQDREHFVRRKRSLSVQL